MFAQGQSRIQRHGLVKLLVQVTLRQAGDGFDQLVLTGLPVAFGRAAGWFVEQLAHLANRGTPLQPGQDRFYPFHLALWVQTVPLRCALWFQQAITALPGAQRDRVHPGAAGQLAYW